MRVVFLPGSFRPDRCGVSHYTAQLMAELSGRGVQSRVLTTHAAARYHQQPEVIGTTQDWGLGMLVTLPGALLHLDADLLHIQHAAGSFAFRRPVLWLPLVLRVRGWQRPIVVTLHEYGWWEWRPRLVGWVWRRLGPWGERRSLWDREDFALLTGADTLIVTNDTAARALMARLPQLAPKVERVPIGPNIPVTATDVAAARAAVRQRFGWPAEALVISYFGFLHPVKGLETLLRAFRRVLDGQPQARLLISGGVESLALHGDEAQRYYGKLRALIGELGLSAAVRVTGYLPEELVSQHLAGADLGVLPFHDGVTLKSGSLLAMWAHGLPVVATRPSLCPPQLEGAACLVPGRDVDALADSLLRLLGDPHARQELGTCARKAAAEYSWPAIAERHLAIYKRLLKVRD